MQAGDALGGVEVDHHGGVVAVGAAVRLGVPAGFDQADKRLQRARQRPDLLAGPVVVVAFPFGDQRFAVRGQGGVECGGIEAV